MAPSTQSTSSGENSTHVSSLFTGARRFASFYVFTSNGTSEASSRSSSSVTHTTFTGTPQRSRSTYYIPSTSGSEQPKAEKIASTSRTSPSSNASSRPQSLPAHPFSQEVDKMQALAEDVRSFIAEKLQASGIDVSSEPHGPITPLLFELFPSNRSYTCICNDSWCHAAFLLTADLLRTEKFNLEKSDAVVKDMQSYLDVWTRLQEEHQKLLSYTEHRLGERIVRLPITLQPTSGANFTVLTPQSSVVVLGTFDSPASSFGKRGSSSSATNPSNNSVNSSSASDIAATTIYQRARSSPLSSISNVSPRTPLFNRRAWRADDLVEGTGRGQQKKVWGKGRRLHGLRSRLATKSQSVRRRLGRAVREILA